MLSRGFVVLLVVLSYYGAHAQYIGLLDHGKDRTKFENNLIISWSGVSDDSSTGQVEIFDVLGHSLVQLNVLRLVPEAARVSIYDISARQGALIAIAAVYGSKEGNSRVVPAAALLTFDFGGRLLSAFALASSRGIYRLELDDQSHIWTLAGYAGEKDDPSQLPMVVEYNSEGVEAKKLFSRTMFPIHSRRIQRSGFIGYPSMGYYSDTLWFWLPGSTDLVTVSTSDSKSVIKKTGVPQISGKEIHPHHLVRTPSGDLVGQFVENGNDGTREWVYYKWSQLSGSWSMFKPVPCDGDELIGVNAGQELYLHYQHGFEQINVCAVETN